MIDALDSLWGDDYSPQTQTKEILNKISKPKKSISGNGLYSKIAAIKDNVYRILGIYKENTITIYDKQQLLDYIESGNRNGVIAVDTETDNSLDPLTCKLMGLCLYTPGQKNAYIPVNHVNLFTRERLQNQLTEDDIKEALCSIKDDTKVIMHNGKFDYQVIKCTTGYLTKCYWDTFIGSRLLNENERAALKQQYINKIDPTIEKYSIEHLFEGLEYAIFDPELFALYAATDSFMTYELYMWQKAQFEMTGNERLYWLFMNVEMPIVIVTAEMELTGVCIDTEFAERLGEKYHKKLDVINAELDVELSKLKDLVDAWRLTPEANYHPEKIVKGEKKFGKSKNEQLSDPINLTSPTQLAILLYDILKAKSVDPKQPRGTGEEILEKMDFPICKKIIEQRGILKLIGTYIDKLPKCINPKTNRVHASFLQLGADTGRFSSKDPNLQNIPSKEKSIRMLFKASPGYTLVGSDFSQQEPRLLANFAQDDNMIGAYKQGKDLYATIAMQINHNDYWDNMEFTDETKTVPNPAGKERRSKVKSLMLGIMYGMGASSLAGSINGTIKEAEKIIKDFYNGFPKVKEWIDDTHTSAAELGYVEDFWGRRRRLPDILLPKYQVYPKGSTGEVTDFNPIFGCFGEFASPVDPKIVDYLKRLNDADSRKVINEIKKSADFEGYEVKDNTFWISQAERQCVNARIQGSAATMSKKAMINVHHDEELNRLGFRLMIAVHDELIGECPEENAEAVADRLTEVMRTCAYPEVNVPFKCDPTIEPVWYYSDYSAKLQAQYSDIKDDPEKVEKFIEEHSECTREQIYKIIGV